jgi:hypothetical protein
MRYVGPLQGIACMSPLGGISVGMSMLGYESP